MHTLMSWIKQHGWSVVLVAWILIIWGNSLMPGEGSGSLSLGVVEWIQGGLMRLGLPYAWVTNFLIRKCAHFSEYALLGILSCLAFKTDWKNRNVALALQVLLLVSVPCIDETIQLFVPGRCGALMDVMIDLSGALTGFVLVQVLKRVFGRS